MKNDKNKIRVGILSGGPSLEYEVSLVTAAQVRKHLDKDKYRATPVKISRTGQWPKNLELAKLAAKIDVAFIAMHGAFGEDGTVQALLQAQNIPFTGSGVLASALAMDKWRSSLVAKSLGLTVPFTILASSNMDIKGFGSKVVVKPNDGGSSVGVQMVAKGKIKSLLKKSSGPMLVQEFIPGREFTVSVLGSAHPQALPVIEIIPKAKFFDYKSKYLSGGAEHIVPAKISARLTAELQTAAASIHFALGCKGASRSDFILGQDGKVYYLETNTIPGMTATSLLPHAAEVAGISFSSLLDMLIVEAL